MNQINARGGFSLIEVLLSVSMLSVGLILVYQPFLRGVSSLGYARDRLEASSLLGGYTWELENEILQQGQLKPLSRHLILLGKNKTFDATAVARMVKRETRALYETEIVLSWVHDGRRKSVTRNTYLGRSWP